MCQAVVVRPELQTPPMRVRERRCVVCGVLADVEQTSAHLARVMFFCTAHGQQFHTSAYFVVARRALATVDCWKAVDAWLTGATEDVELESARRVSA